MALNQRLAVALQNLMANQLSSLIGASGFLDIYDGTQPANPDTAVTTQVKLAHLALSATAFANAASGAAAANAISSAAALATSTATWARFTKSDGTAVMDCSVGTSGANINLNSVAIQINATVQVTSYSFSVPMQGT